MKERNLVIGGVFRQNVACPAFVPRVNADLQPNAICERCAWRWDIFCRRSVWGWAAIPSPRPAAGASDDSYDDPATEAERNQD